MFMDRFSPLVGRSTLGFLAHCAHSCACSCAHCARSYALSCAQVLVLLLLLEESYWRAKSAFLGGAQ